jgi:hypothetical protein
VKQTKQGTFMHQTKYTKDLMKKFNMVELKPVSTPMSTSTSHGPDKDGKTVDQREYRSMIGTLLYLTTTWLDIPFAVCLCARFQASPRSLRVVGLTERALLVLVIFLNLLLFVGLLKNNLHLPNPPQRASM